MKESDEMILEKNGWIIECESPFEICFTETNDRATGVAAQLILHFLKEHEKKKNGKRITSS